MGRIHDGAGGFLSIDRLGDYILKSREDVFHVEQEIKKLTKAVEKLAKELKRYNEKSETFDPTKLPDVKVSLGQRNEGRTFANMLARAMSQDADEQVREKMEEIAAALKAEQAKKYRSRGGQS